MTKLTTLSLKRSRYCLPTPCQGLCWLGSIRQVSPNSKKLPGKSFRPRSCWEMSKPSKSLHSLIQSSKPCDYWNLILRLETPFLWYKNWGANCAAWSTHQLAFSCAFLSSTNLFQIHKTQAFLRLRLSAEEVALTKHGQHLSFCWIIIVMTKIQKNKVFLILVENRGNQKKYTIFHTK